MSGSRPLIVLAATFLATAAFLAGRYSAPSAQQADESGAAPSSNLRASKLSAITKSPNQSSPTPDIPKHIQKFPASPQPGELGNVAADKVAGFLAKLSERVDEEADVAELISEWLEYDPDGAIAWLARGDRRDDTMKTVFAIWGDTDHEAATAWLDSHRDLEWHDPASAGLAAGLASNGEAALALNRIGSLRDPFAIAQVWNLAGKQLYITEPEATLEQFAASGLPDDLRSLAIEQWKIAAQRRAKRNAQNLASVYSSAFAAGASFKGSTAHEVAEELVAGVTGSDSFSGTVFQVPNLSGAQLTAALSNLKFDDARFIYDPAD